MIIYNHLKTTHDTSGNPRRLFDVYEMRDGMFWQVAVIEEGYHGRRAILARYPDAIECTTYSITPGEYRQMKKEASRHGKFHP